MIGGQNIRLTFLGVEALNGNRMPSMNAFERAQSTASVREHQSPKPKTTAGLEDANQKGTDPQERDGDSHR
ncbi:MAG: hypothetical protein CM15mP3_05030 [Candidatus Poseidoniales archaeon]|nr:MAG: hypothetical protein CM15mP3_05030 [Candidatus Poseidoniales archaeon]